MSLKKRGKYWHYEFMMGGERYWGSTKETSTSRAETFQSLRMAEVRDGSLSPGMRKIPTLRDFSTTFLGFLQEQVNARNLSEGTRNYYFYGWQLLKETKLAGWRLDQITRNEVSAISFAGSPSSANEAIRTLRRMLSLAVEKKLLRSSPKIKTLREEGRADLIESDHEELLLDVAPQPLKDVLQIMMDTGMRPEEVMRLRWEHVLWVRRVIFVPYGKSERSRRHVPLSDRVASLLQSRASERATLHRNVWARPLRQLASEYGISDVGLGKECRKTGIPLPGRGHWGKKAALRGVPTTSELEPSTGLWVFPSRRAASGHLTTVDKLWRETCLRANEVLLKRGRPPMSEALVLYCARHTFATDMLEHMNLAQVKDLMGHANIATTMKYLHPQTSSATDAVNQRNKKRGMRLVKGANSDIYSDTDISEAM